ncbi:MAG: TetR family transcriptional regulator [Actinomycetota bacterium]|jgi:AcrR family transcriptional regulator|nr:TetR family transcriptional regulator [Actinomycetota bacterium]
MARVAAHDRRQQLIEAAIRVAERDGIAATTTRRIATEAGASLATVHYCFRSKQELFEQVLTAIITELSEAAQADIRPGRDAATLLREGMRALWVVVEKEPGKQQLTYELTHYALRQPGMESFAQWQYETSYAACTAHLEGVADAAGIVWSIPMPVLTRMLMTVIDGVVLGWLVDRDSDSALAALDALADLLATLAVEVG